MHHGRIPKLTAKGLKILQERIAAAAIPSSKLDESLNIASLEVHPGKRERPRARWQSSTSSAYAAAVHMFDARPPPLTIDKGVVRVQGTRVSLDSIVYAFDRGASPEEIVESYPTLDLATMYATLACVLQNREEVDRYLKLRRAEADRLHAEIEQRFPPDGIRARLRSRRSRPST